MKDLSYHILDVVQNSIHAGASRVEISIVEDTTKGLLTLTIDDDGCGMSAEMMTRVTDPFFTSSVTKKVGLGLPLLKQNAELTGGQFRIESEPGRGTTVTAVFHIHHIDIIPTGDLAMTLRMLVASNPDKDFICSYQKNGVGFILDTTEMREQLGDIRLCTREVLDYITDYITDNLATMSVFKD